jgi:hypothetical protein
MYLQFQRDFFLIRQAEYKPYTDALGDGMVKQGDLADPYYFDFISFAQYTTINREITMDPPMMFTEMLPVDVGENEQQIFDKRIIRRDPSITNDMLPSEVGRRVGATILNRFDEILGQTGASLPNVEQGSRPGSGECISVIWNGNPWLIDCIVD